MSEWLHEWLHPIVGTATEIQAANMGEFAHHAPFGGGELLWAVLSTVAALVVVLGAARVVGGFKILPAADAPKPEGFKKVLYMKYYVDEIYDRVIVQTTIDMCHSLGYTVVAEGVEYEETMTLLEAMGCDMIQGFFLTPPLPLDELKQWLRDRERLDTASLRA